MDANAWMATVAEAVDTASIRLANQLRTPADLHQVEALRARVSAERATKEAQLKGAMRNHLDSASFALYLMQHSLEEFDNVTANFAAVENLVSESQAQLAAYPLIKSVYTTHRNFSTTLQLVNDLASLPKKIKEVEVLLEDDSKNFMRAHNLLFVYIEIYKLEQLRDATVARATAATASQEALRELEERFSGVRAVSDAFEQMLMTLAGKLLQLTQRHASTIVKIAKVVEFAEKADRLAEKKGFNAKPRRFRDKLFSRLQRSIEEHFEGGVAQFAEGKDVDAALRSLNFMIDDLTLVLDEIAPRFPPDWDIFMYYVKTYHQQMSSMLLELVRTRRDPKEILMLFSWVDAYYKNLKSRLGIEPDILAPRLLDEQIPKLTSDYVQLVHSKVAEWTDNLFNVESRDFKTRDKPPEHDLAQLYITSAPVILFQMMSQQVDLAATSGREQLVVDIIIECCDVMQSFQDSLTNMFKTEETFYLNNRDDAPSGLIEYLMAMVNNQGKSSEFTLQLVERLKRDVRGHAALVVEKRLIDVEEGFRNVAKAALTSLRRIVFLDVTAFMEACFTNRGYDEPLIENTIATLEDYTNDIQKHLSEYHFNKFMYECLDEVVLGYLMACTSKSAIFRPGAYARKFDSDVKTISQFFGRFLLEKRVAKVLQVIVDMSKLMSGPIDTLPAQIAHMKMSYRDAPSNLYEKILARRPDLASRSALQKVMTDVSTQQIGGVIETSALLAPVGSEETLLGKIKVG